MNLFALFKAEIDKELAALAEDGLVPQGADTSAVTAEPPRDPAHGDISTNAALVLAKAAGRKPRDIAEPLAERMRVHPDVTEAEVAGPGFVNLRLGPSFWQARLGEILDAGAGYGDSRLGAGRKVNVEYVSANPTGPLHVGHARGAVVGDALSALLEKAGYAVTREYYINDAGAQVDTLARSVHLRYCEALGDAVSEIAEGLYPGEYLVPVGAALAERDGDKWRDQPEDAWMEPVRDFALEAMMALIRDDLAALGVTHAVFTSERSVVDTGAVDQAFRDLEDKGLIYEGVLEPPKGKTPEDWEPRPQHLFRSTEFGDDVDRPLKKSDGSWTYFATDIAYHRDKVRRGFADMIDVWGADHGGYVKRMKSAVRAISDGEAALDVLLCQLVKLTKAGEPVKMSKRAGTFVTLRDVIDEVGKDVVRFIMLTRKNDAPLDFDLAKVLEQSRENPVWYVQYAHARCHSVFRNAAEAFPEMDLSRAALRRTDHALLSGELELSLIKRLATWPRIVESAAEAHEPHRIAFFLYDLAGEFHGLWTKGKDDEALRFIVPGDQATTHARMALVQAVADVVASGLAVMGVEPVEEM